MLNWTTQALNSVMATPPNPAVLAARESAAAAAALVGESPGLGSLSLSPSAATNADKDVAIVERQIKSLTRRLQRCDLEVSAATTLFRSALIQEQASARSGNAGEIEHAQNSLAARERELQDALTKRNEAADALAKAQDRLTQLNKLFETPHREESTSRPQDLPQIPPPPGLSSSSPFLEYL